MTHGRLRRTMETTATTRPLLAGGLLAAALLLLPSVAALPVGVDATGMGDLRAAGVVPAYGQTWVGEWMETYGWSGFETDLRAMRDAGVTPVVMWYYWGDGIRVDAVRDGSGGKSKAEWDAMARDMARRAVAVLGSREFLVVLEPEFNKNGIQSWEAFDGHLADQSYAIQAIAPSAKVVVGFGHWGGWDLFDRAMAASDYAGFQILRGSTRDSTGSAEGAADEALRLTRELKQRFGKGVFLFDLGIATYGGWDGVQERALQRFVAKEGELEAAGLKGLVWRYVRDNGLSSGYFGPAESTWGVMTGGGARKPGFDDLVALARAPAASAAPAPAPGAFSGVKGNEWWIQATVAGAPRKVEARVDGGAWVALAWQSWGAWAVSTHAPAGSTVELRATYADGATASARHPWPPGGAAATFDATFSRVGGNGWWIQTDVAANQPLAHVAVRVNGGGWIALAKQSWGAWATSTRLPAGSWVELQATSTTGATDRSGGVAWAG